MILLLDNYDSFTYNVYELFIIWGFKVLVLNFIPRDFIISGFTCVCIGPGTGSPLNYPFLLWWLSRIYLFVPIIGICLGHQVLGFFFGYWFYGARFLVHGLLTLVYIRNDVLSFGVPCNFYVVRYNSLFVRLSIGVLTFISYCTFKNCMVFKHKVLPIIGIQFHPDSFMCSYGKKIILNFLLINEIA
ncbi:aminodeoxychorismate/anthranilate synthase component II [Candidatus Vidania fulgoroideae]|uniref:Aminodeoxychorismate/anthranilate synthase component II n=1 Tax=Candidatus Vidania fulgoroideorum TaxID=881286 RepID=A0A974XA81_9PROT|nr:aminodeoxychorismate/anthranilate synthase component II [Candidatus Vidania fulgoroideae]